MAGPDVSGRCSQVAYCGDPVAAAGALAASVSSEICSRGIDRSSARVDAGAETYDASRCWGAAAKPCSAAPTPSADVRSLSDIERP